ncbi:uncharacterized protein LOC135825739 [Sycon ciliatum]|uniref:uncharacterized protein LOC135825739 n=1 Tax=Sycon ciliatum TaxID=27933 RepID=UPI0020ADB3EF|eukprot:scpid38399/ scgid35026/ 
MSWSTTKVSAVSASAGVLAFILLLIIWKLVKHCGRKREKPTEYDGEKPGQAPNGPQGPYRDGFEQLAHHRTDTTTTSREPPQQSKSTFRPRLSPYRFPSRPSILLSGGAQTTYPEPSFSSSSQFINGDSPRQESQPCAPDYPTNISDAGFTDGSPGRRVSRTVVIDQSERLSVHQKPDRSMLNGRASTGFTPQSASPATHTGIPKRQRYGSRLAPPRRPLRPGSGAAAAPSKLLTCVGRQSVSATPRRIGTCHRPVDPPTQGHRASSTHRPSRTGTPRKPPALLYNCRDSAGSLTSFLTSDDEEPFDDATYTSTGDLLLPESDEGTDGGSPIHEQPSFPEPDEHMLAGSGSGGGGSGQGILNIRLRYMSDDGRLEVLVHSARCLPECTRSACVQVKVMKKTKVAYNSVRRHSSRETLPPSPADLATASAASAAASQSRFPQPTNRRLERKVWLAKGNLEQDNRNPLFNQLLEFDGVDRGEIANGRMSLTVLDNAAQQRSGRRVGKICLALSDLKLGVKWRMLSLSLDQNTTFLANPDTPRGQLVVGLHFSANGSKLRCRVLRAQELPRPKNNKSFSAQARVRLMSAKTEVRRSNSALVHCDNVNHADFNHETTFDLDGLQRDRLYIACTVKARVSIFKHRSYEVGKVTLGPHASEDAERHQWAEAEGMSEAVHTHTLHC